MAEQEYLKNLENEKKKKDEDNYEDYDIPFQYNFESPLNFRYMRISADGKFEED